MYSVAIDLISFPVEHEPEPESQRGIREVNAKSVGLASINEKLRTGLCPIPTGLAAEAQAALKITPEAARMVMIG